MRKLLYGGLLAALFIAATPAALADRPGHGWHGDIHHPGGHDMGRWRGGHWYHGSHGGYAGWWWVVGPAWYFYPAPVYPYPDPYTPPVVVQQAPPTVVIQQAPPAPPAPTTAPPAPQAWYYCDAAKGYYPYVPACPSGWVQVPATPASPPPAAPPR